MSPEGMTQLAAVQRDGAGPGAVVRDIRMRRRDSVCLACVNQPCELGTIPIRTRNKHPGVGEFIARSGSLGLTGVLFASPRDEAR